MTFGTEWGWGTEKDECRRIFDAYVEAGGNFVDTANLYTDGASETMLGEFIGARTLAQLHDNLAAATFVLSVDQMARLDEASKIDPRYPHTYLRSAGVTKFLCGGTKIE
jgi:aryl-alcohol dehydrogenase-like predicted oxidoreductase